MRNREIRMIARENAVFLWEIAERLGITDASFSRKLRHELPEDEKQKIFKIINDIAKEREEECE